mmetsp:Transcript_20226/g.60321  ORF Transcript_20226/g.60321 Transcript_20226/m.60321 type:complete len:352 (-) Transcript_20226:410-1465(-)
MARAHPDRRRGLGRGPAHEVRWHRGLRRRARGRALRAARHAPRPDGERGRRPGALHAPGDGGRGRDRRSRQIAGSGPGRGAPRPRDRRRPHPALWRAQGYGLRLLPHHVPAAGRRRLGRAARRGLCLGDARRGLRGRGRRLRSSVRSRRRGEREAARFTKQSHGHGRAPRRPRGSHELLRGPRAHGAAAGRAPELPACRQRDARRGSARRRRGRDPVRDEPAAAPPLALRRGAKGDHEAVVGRGTGASGRRLGDRRTPPAPGGRGPRVHHQHCRRRGLVLDSERELQRALGRGLLSLRRLPRVHERPDLRLRLLRGARRPLPRGRRRGHLLLAHEPHVPALRRGRGLAGRL